MTEITKQERTLREVRRIQALIEAARVDVRAESFLEHAQAILGKCVAPYSCEQMKAVADVLASNFSKLELVRELADKATEERAAAIARAEAAEAREAKLREVLQVIAAPCGTEGPLWATMHARSALAQGGA